MSVLPVGTSLLVQMKVPEDSNLAKPMRQYLKDTTSAHREEFPLEMASQGGYYAEVILKSHLSMCLRGTKEATLEDCECQLLCLAEEAGSLNEAYTKLSTALEPHRRSHTGNAFQRVFYKENEYWRPLSHLRDLHQAQAEKDLFSESK